MVKDNEPWPCPEPSAWQRVNKSFTSSLLGDMPAWTNFAHMAFPFPFPSLGTEQTAPSKQFVYPPGFPRMALLNAIPPPYTQKKLMVFDRCGTQTRLLYSSTTPATDTAKATSHHGLLGDAKVDRIVLTKPVEHYCGDDESELHEDTEELNALLYSDDDESSDEERSTGHSPVPNAEELAEVSSSGLSKKRPKPDVSDSSGPKPDKRQKLIGLGTGPNQYETGSGSDIRDTLRVLESIVPGVKGKEPLLVLDKAIEYLKCMKLRAVTLGVDSLLT